MTITNYSFQYFLKIKGKEILWHLDIMLEIFIDHAITELYFNRNHLMSSKKDFLNFLMENYISNKTDLTFRQLVSTYFRIYGKSNREEN